MGTAALRSYVVHIELWGKGIGSAIGDQLTGWAFTHVAGLERLEATCDPRNSASASVLQARRHDLRRNPSACPADSRWMARLPGLQHLAQRMGPRIPDRTNCSRALRLVSRAPSGGLTVSPHGSSETTAFGTRPGVTSQVEVALPS